jgi:alkylhydroperoxidase/carboxymuconolactone decarboxylase family protein YurZ
VSASTPWQHPRGPQAEAALTPEQRRIREGFTQRRGYWADDWQLILELAPEVMQAYTDFSAYAWEHGTLDRKTREFMYIATTSVVTHIHPIGIETHGRNAIAAGATPQELVTLLALMGGIGIRGYLMAIDVIEEVRPGATRRPNNDPQRLTRLRAEYERIFGAWDDAVGTAIQVDPDYFDAYLKWAAAPRTSGVLGPKVVALIAIAANATVTHLDRPTLKREVQAALAMGVTPAEILEVCSMTAGVSVHSLTVGMPIVAGLMREEGKA